MTADSTPDVRRDPAWTPTVGDRLRALDLAEARADQDDARVAEIIVDVALGRDPLARTMHLLRYYVSLSPEADAEFLEYLRLRTEADAFDAIVGHVEDW